LKKIRDRSIKILRRSTIYLERRKKRFLLLLKFSERRLN
jgi:hypothetical protein